MRKQTITAFLAVAACVAGLTAGSRPVFADASLDTTLWTLNYDDSVWQYEEDDLRDDESNSSLELMIPGEEDDAVVTVEIRANITSPYGFRDDLYARGIDERTYVEDNASLEHAEIGGLSLLKYESTYWGDPSVCYFDRLEAAKETVSVRVFGDLENQADAVQAFLDGLTFKVTDIGNVDGPWYWQGTPYDVEDLSPVVGDVTIHSEFLKMADPFITHETFSHDIAVVDNKVYLLSKNLLKVYDLAEGALTQETEYDLGTDFSFIQNTSDGRLFLSGFGRALTEWKDGEAVNSWKGSDIDYVAMSPDGSYGISYFTKGEECMKLTLHEDGTYDAAPIAFNECKTIMHLNTNDDHIFVCGDSSVEDEKGHFIFVYDTEGNLEHKLSAEGENIGLGSVTYVFETEKYYVALDGNMRTIPVWNKEGAYLGRTEDSDLFGTDYPWFCNSTIATDGSFYTVMTEERADKSADEVLVFRLSGF